MTRKEFLKWFVDTTAREAANDRPSCRAASIADAMERGPKLWRRYRAMLAPMTVQEWDRTRAARTRAALDAVPTVADGPPYDAATATGMYDHD